MTSGGVTENATVNVTINAVNDAPTFDDLDNTPVYTENGAAVVLDTSVTIFDVELDALNSGTGNYNGAVLTLARSGGANSDDVFGAAGTLSFSGVDVLVGATSVGTVTNANGQLQITFNANATSALASSVARQITYQNSSDGPPPSVQIGYTVSDGNAGSQGVGLTPGTGNGSITVGITPVNDAPVLSGLTPNVIVPPAGGPKKLSPGAIVSDLDSATLTSATVRVSDGNFAADGDVLAVAAGALTGTNITATYNTATETLTLSGVDTLAHYRQVLDNVTFDATGSNPTNSGANSTRTIEWQLNDGSGASNLSIPQSTTVDLAAPPAFDFNGDGKGDILFQNLDGTPAVWLLDGTGVLTMGPPLPNPNAGQPPVGQNGQPAPWREIGAGDFNGDGRSDLLWQHSDGRAAVWLMDGMNVVATGPALSNPGATWKAKEAADFNGDGKADILWQNDDGTAGVWLMDGTNVLQTGGALANPGPSWHTKAAADFNGDGKADILWQNDNGTTGIWLMDGVNVLQTGGALPNADQAWHAAAAGDFDGDGKADILWQNDSGAVAVWLMDGTSVVSMGPPLSNPGPTWHVKEAIDANADGRADVLWQNDNGTPGVWLMDGTSVLQTGGALHNPGAVWHIV